MDTIWLIILTNVILLAAVFAGTFALAGPARRWILRQEHVYGYILRRGLLIDIEPRQATYIWLACVGIGAVLAYLFVQSIVVMLIGALIGGGIPMLLLRVLRLRRKAKLEDQLVDGVQTLASGVRAGLNLVQAFELVARNLPAPIRQEFAHMLREYEYGTSLDRAMASAADRIESSNYRLLFSALQTHRERGGDLGETLDRIANSIREIQRLEKHIETLTAQNRTVARWMGVMPAVILGILYILDPVGVGWLFTETAGKIMLSIVIALIVAGFLWVRQIVNIDI